MITIEAICQETHLDRTELERWIAHAWVRPDGPPGAYRFRAIDTARVHLILDLRHTMQVNDDAMPVVLSLLDQLYDTRRHLHRLHAALSTVPADLRTQLAQLLREAGADRG